MGRSSRSWYAVWELLDKEQRAAICAYQGYPPEWRPGREMPPVRPRGLEGLAEIGRIMRMRPGLIGNWPDEAIERTERGGE